jgi:hypothetical protein
VLRPAPLGARQSRRPSPSVSTASVNARPEGAIRRSRWDQRRTGWRPASAFDEAAGACTGHAGLGRDGFEGPVARDRDRQGGVNRRRPSARRPDDTKRRVLRGAPTEARGPRVRRIAARQARHWGQASSARRAGRAVEQAVPEETFTLGKPVRDGGGSHRRSRSGNTVALMDVATKTPVTRAPLRARRHEGKEQLPYALGAPCIGAR